MRIDSLLNSGPDPGPGVDAVIPGLEQPPPGQMAGGDKHTLVNGGSRAISSACLGDQLAMFTPHHPPYQDPPSPYRGHTASSRSSYSEPSLTPSTAATSPLGTSTTMRPHINSWGGEKLPTHSGTAPTASIPGRDRSTDSAYQLLPPLTALVTMQQHSTASTETAMSPRTSQEELSPLASTQVRYLPNVPYQVQYPPSQSFYQVPQHQLQSPARYATHGQEADSDPLMRFADVAMESATAGGRRTLERVAAAEALKARRGCTAGPMGRADVDDTRSEHQFHQRSDSLSIDPALRQDVSVRASNALIRTTSMATQTQEDRPLFHPSPESFSPSSVLTLTGSASPGVPAGNLSTSSCEFLNEEPKCSYCNVCTTGSPLRKVVSHIFGRNKLSTRLIPKKVWVYYCRKHYQRSRYRNPRGFARQQVLLVRRQCERLEQWGGVTRWVIKVRRREELRMNREGDNGEELDDPDEENDDEIAVPVGDDIQPAGTLYGENSSGPSGPIFRRRSSTGSSSNWIVKHMGINKTIQDIYELLDKIELEVQQNGGKFPDVELLPSVDLGLAVSMSMNRNSDPADQDEDQDEDTGSKSSTKSKKRGRSSKGNDDRSSGDSGGPVKRARITSSTKRIDRASDSQVEDMDKSQYNYQQAKLSPWACGSATGGNRQDELSEAPRPDSNSHSRPQTSFSVSSGQRSSTTAASCELDDNHHSADTPGSLHTVEQTSRLFPLLQPRASYSSGDCGPGLTQRQVAAITGPPLRRFHLRRHPDMRVFGGPLPAR